MIILKMFFDYNEQNNNKLKKRNLKNIYKKYFQKSKIFLYPLLGIKKGITFVPNETYMSWDNLYTINDNKLILLYKISIDKLIDYNLFEKNHLKKNKFG